MKDRILLSTGVALCLLIGEWWLISLEAKGLSQIDINKTLLALVAAGSVIGLASGILATWLSRRLEGSRCAIALAVAGLAFLEMFAAQGATLTGTAIVASLASGILGLILVYSLAAKLPGCLLEYRYWWWIAIAGFGITVALSAGAALDTAGTVTALVAVAISAAVVVWGFRIRTRGFLPSAIGFIILLTANTIIVFRVPLISAKSASDTNPPSILLFTIDTLRADHVGAYGNPNARTPNLDSLAKQGVLFKQTVTANAYTGPSHTSIMTGLLPGNHGVVKNEMRIPPGVPTLADWLFDEGYITAAFVSGFTTRDSACGLPSRFQVYDDDIRAVRWLPKAGFEIPALTFVEKFQKFTGLHRGDFGQFYRQAAETADIAIDWLEQNGDRPYFVWVHLYDPHSPYRPPENFVKPSTKRAGASGVWYRASYRERGEIVNSPEKMAAMIDLYDAEIAYADHELGRILDVARRKAAKGRLIVIATSDHGESLGEHDLYWERDLYDDTALVPLIIDTQDSEGLPARTVDAQVRLIDLAPTILDLLGVESSVRFDGHSLAGLIKGTTAESSGPAVSEKFRTKALFPEIRIVRTNDWKYLQRFPGSDGSSPIRAPVKELYHLPTDKREESNLIEAGKAVPEGFDSILEAQTPKVEAEELDLNKEDLDSLKSLGYIQ
ncbi:MAG: sulfatase [Methylococcaceae bacterium]|nr:sulfatase [Methylococcaceae bacterium]